jgi:hypothetical protein
MGQLAYALAYPTGHVKGERRGRQFDGQRQDQRSGGRVRGRGGADVEPCIGNQQGGKHCCREDHPGIQPECQAGGQVYGQHLDQVKAGPGGR